MPEFKKPHALTAQAARTESCTDWWLRSSTKWVSRARPSEFAR